jgi:carbon-monoxide dehydrogenase small subunit
MDSGETATVRLTVNGAAREGRCPPRKLLVDFLREDLGLTGTHVGCEHGICGACTILVNGEAARSCLMLTVQADGADLTTVEGLMQDGKLHPLQEAFREHHGLQCGFCTPGMLLTALDFLRVNPEPTESEIREGISAVLCRCTGYQGIIKAVAAAAVELRLLSARPSGRSASRAASGGEGSPSTPGVGSAQAPRRQI